MKCLLWLAALVAVAQAATHVRSGKPDLQHYAKKPVPTDVIELPPDLIPDDGSDDEPDEPGTPKWGY